MTDQESYNQSLEGERALIEEKTRDYSETRRDYFKEALDICDEKTLILPQREHLLALLEFVEKKL